MKVHHEGRDVLVTYFIILALLNGALWYFFHQSVLSYFIGGISLILFLIVLNFYRSPYRRFKGETKDIVVASADGKIVAIEEVYESEYFNDRRLLVSIFMSPFNVHANWYPINGKVLESKHHDGRFMAAYLPKSSTENERSTVVMETEDGKHQILLRQVAGAMARRIVTYARVGEVAHIDEHLGFIKLGSRVDVYLPLGTEILVEMDQKVTGNQTVIAKFKP
ncbi:phosphatidylserine decarboxylase family protein [Dysgonomonas sp. 511]|uniref:phosphatidylserine decarboxylase family protein n=1 Tax=Dysgonomonas sp. 511 TaxID=2302930 RepID=UPI0013D3E401|nr:phosphatidylserine decarboxylase family protein [Dysgonomonas sp. 511]NDV78740.1 phosphatidylserine decarboxylase family protein [Dysgonomonas sp. 511]